ncbi:hypothetical protein [uncultured Thiodictyon sp.]|uniref:hypothetical protein n=1 Tax=uncultured Thiodictyon sp. TaxID=1846217 RepID=UPI0025F26385|nr:hypothetical protein [uncultured Thiodictyon sp.]
MANEHTGSETIGAAGDRGTMTLFRSDRAEDLGAIALAVLVVVVVVVLTVFMKPPAAATPAPAAPAALPGAAPGR